jgi:hypothetical protein
MATSYCGVDGAPFNEEGNCTSEPCVSNGKRVEQQAVKGDTLPGGWRGIQ